MINEEILKNVQEVGIKNGYRLDHPEDWYGGITHKDLKKHTGPLYKNFTTINNAIRELFPDYNFLEWKFKKVSQKWWDNFENLKIVLLPECEKLGRMLNWQELGKIKGLKYAVVKHGGIIHIASVLGFETYDKYITLSGDIVGSLYEMIFSNFCYLNNIKYEHEHPIDKYTKYRCDFKINDFYIEIWGLCCFDDYNKTKKIKEQIYQKNNLKLISLSSDLFKNHGIGYINNHLIELVKSHGLKMDNFYDGDLNYLTKFDSFNKRVAIDIIKQECLDKQFTYFPIKKYWLNSKFKKVIKFLETSKINIIELAKICNLPTSKEFNKIKPPNYWVDINNVTNEIKQIINEFGYMPNLKNIPRHDLLNGIVKYHGGVKAIKKQLNLI